VEINYQGAGLSYILKSAHVKIKTNLFITAPILTRLRMKRILILVIILSALNTKGQPKYLMAGNWQGKDFEAIEDSIQTILGSTYILTKRDIHLPANKVSYNFTNYTTQKDFFIAIFPAGQPTLQVASIIMSGAYADVFKVFQRMFAPNANAQAIKALTALPVFGLCKRNIRVIKEGDTGYIDGEVVVDFRSLPETDTWRLSITEPRF
jgi:hypothetical protein